MSICVEHWTSRLKPSTGQLARRHLRLFMRWLQQHGGPFTEYSPDQLVAYQRSADNSHRYDVLDVVQRHVLSLTGRKSSKTSRYTYLRSFFLHNRAELPRDRSFRIRGDEPRSRGTLTVEEVRRVILSASPLHRAVYLCMLQGGMGSHELLYWNRHGLTQLEQDLRGRPSVIRVDLPGRKAGENERLFYTFLGGDAIVALRTWMPLRPHGSAVIFATRYGAPLSYSTIQAYWRRRLRRLGIGPTDLRPRRGRTGKSPHELRDLLRSQWAKSPAKPEVAEFCMGHMIDPLEYNKSFRDARFYRDEYVKALPYLQILSSGTPFHQVDEEEVASLRAEIEQLRAERALTGALQQRVESNDELIAELRNELAELSRLVKHREK